MTRSTPSSRRRWTCSRSGTMSSGETATAGSEVLRKGGDRLVDDQIVQRRVLAVRAQQVKVREGVPRDAAAGLVRHHFPLLDVRALEPLEPGEGVIENPDVPVTPAALEQDPAELKLVRRPPGATAFPG